MKYKNEWKENSVNQEFWKEVLIGRTIVDLKFDNNGLKYFVLDNGEKVYPFDNTILIQTENQEYVSSFYDPGINFMNYSRLSNEIKNLPNDIYISNLKCTFDSSTIECQESKFLTINLSEIIRND